VAPLEQQGPQDAEAGPAWAQLVKAYAAAAAEGSTSPPGARRRGQIGRHQERWDCDALRRAAEMEALDMGREPRLANPLLLQAIEAGCGRPLQIEALPKGASAASSPSRYRQTPDGVLHPARQRRSLAGGCTKRTGSHPLHQALCDSAAGRCPRGHCRWWRASRIRGVQGRRQNFAGRDFEDRRLPVPHRPGWRWGRDVIEAHRFGDIDLV